MRKLCPSVGSYLSESNFFERRLAATRSGARTTRGCCAVKDSDTTPTGLFFVHHGVGSEGWSADGFERAA